MVGSLLWLSQATRPDLATVVSLLAQHQVNPSMQHIKAAKHAIKYVSGTKTRGISFSSQSSDTLAAFLNFPVSPTKILPFADANWGGQDQTTPDPMKPQELMRFASRSMSGFIIFTNGPLHWMSKRQKITARSSAEAEIYATDECVKELLRLQHMLTDLNLKHIFMPTSSPIELYNDNTACVCWSKKTTTKGLRHITVRENAIRESIDSKFISVKHIGSKQNLADIFTKEFKNMSLFLTLRDMITSIAPLIKINSHSKGGIARYVRAYAPHQ